MIRRNLTSTLDRALSRLRGGEPVPQILADYPAEADRLRPLLETAAQLMPLETVGMPSADAREVQRRRFLQEAAQIRAEPVSPALLERLIGWKNPTRRRARAMLVPVIKILLILGLLAGAAGGTALAADASVPGDPLYSLDLALEDLQLALTVDPADEVDLQIRQLNERVEEMMRLVERGEEINETMLTRFHLHLSTCLDRMAELDEPEMLREMERLRATVQAQTQLMSLLEEETGNETSRRALERAIRLMAEVQAMVEEGLEDPATFRLHHQLRMGPPEEVPIFPTPRIIEPPGPHLTPPMGPKEGGPQGPSHEIPRPFVTPPVPSGHGQGMGTPEGLRPTLPGEGMGDHFPTPMGPPKAPQPPSGGGANH